MRRLDGLLQGDYRTIFKGQGLDLADIREYAFGDDVRHIDWNVTARLDAPYVREYHEDREINAHFLLDLSPSVDFGTVDRRKRDLLIDFTAILAHELLKDPRHLDGADPPGFPQIRPHRPRMVPRLLTSVRRRSTIRPRRTGVSRRPFF